MNLTLKDKAKVFSAEVVFGNPSKSCSGTGICKVTTPQSLDICSCKKVEASLRWGPGFNSILIDFPVAVINEKIRARYFDNKYFKIEEQVEIPSEIMNGWGAILKKGYYLPMTNHPQFIRLEINCTRIGGQISGEEYQLSSQQLHY